MTRRIAGKTRAILRLPQGSETVLNVSGFVLSLYNLPLSSHPPPAQPLLAEAQSLALRHSGIQVQKKVENSTIPPCH